MRIRIDEELPKTGRALKAIGKELSDARLDAAKVRDLTLPPSTGAVKQDVSDIEQAAKEGLRKISVNPELVKQGTVFVLKQGKEILPTLFKGIGIKTMGKWGTVAGKFAGPLVSVGLMIFEFINAQQAEKENREAQTRYHQAVQEAARDVTRDLRSSFRNNIAKLVDSIFHPIELWLAEQKAADANQSVTIQQEKSLLAQAKKVLLEV
jgi:hypothetical protein